MLAILLTGQFMALLDVSVVNVAMPSMRDDLGASGSALQLVVAGYTVSYAMLLITGARLGDLYGNRRVFLIGLYAFTASSLLCGIAPNATLLIIARFLQGAGAALMMPQVMSVIQVQFSGAARAAALSAYTAVISVAGIAGMLLGGVLVSADLFGTGWRPVFLINLPLGLAVAALVPRLMPADRPTGTRKLDVTGLAIAVPAVFLIVLPLVLGHEQGWPLWTFVAMAAGLLLAILFVAVERRVAARGGDPLLNLAVLRVPGVTAGLLSVLFGMTAYGGFLFSMAVHLQSGLGDGALRAGLTFLPAGIGFGFFGYYWRRLLPQRTHHVLTPIGFGFAAAGYALIALILWGGTHGGLALPLALLMTGAVMGIAFSPMVTNSLVHVPLSEAADASGLLTTALQLGQVVGVATLGSLFLTLDGGAGPERSGTAIAITFGLAAALMALGVLTGSVLARAAKQPAMT